MDPFNPVQANGVDLTTESLKEERDALSRRIQELDKLIKAHHAETIKQAAMRKQKQNSELNQGSVIYRLPPELLSRITYLYSLLDWHNDTYMAPPGGRQLIEDESLDPYAWIRITHVCQYWRHVALNTPELWTQITFGWHYQKQTDGIMGRSKTLPLARIRMIPRRKQSPNLQERDQYFAFVREHIAHLQELSLDVTYASVTNHTSISLETAAPSLRVLEFTSRTLAFVAPLLSSARLPHLEALSYTAERATQSHPPLRLFPCRSLRKLVLRGNFNLPTPLLDFFSQFPLLEYLVLHAYESGIHTHDWDRYHTPNPHTSRPIIFPYMKLLSVAPEEDEFICDFLHTFRLPPQAKLAIHAHEIPIMHTFDETNIEATIVAGLEGLHSAEFSTVLVEMAGGTVTLKCWTSILVPPIPTEPCQTHIRYAEGPDFYFDFSIGEMDLLEEVWQLLHPEFITTLVVMTSKEFALTVKKWNRILSFATSVESLYCVDEGDDTLIACLCHGRHDEQRPILPRLQNLFISHSALLLFERWPIREALTEYLDRRRETGNPLHLLSLRQDRSYENTHAWNSDILKTWESLVLELGTW